MFVCAIFAGIVEDRLAHQIPQRGGEEEHAAHETAKYPARNTVERDARVALSGPTAERAPEPRGNGDQNCYPEGHPERDPLLFADPDVALLPVLERVGQTSKGITGHDFPGREASATELLNRKFVPREATRFGC
ncbi:hypothetical protein J8F10_11040 [Gemmata sp. G18]|uniref:Uncharacterized protein n=1 Tax=Gemmata palustris TaxID=2822762 RepID=A0ABS5BQ67_9BACT|nr:hypothetical protein [Gemmata palustris]MBP3955819.1 hypothetical protein [Gemmata palustris]